MASSWMKVGKDQKDVSMTGGENLRKEVIEQFTRKVQTWDLEELTQRRRNAMEQILSGNLPTLSLMNAELIETELMIRGAKVL